MQWRRMAAATIGAGALAGAVVLAQNGTPINPDSKNVLTVAVYGDSPYGTSPTDTTETDLTPAFIASINADPNVDLVLHVGDIHSGSQFCTEAYDRTIFTLWTAYKNPLIYTPGDNEWADCHKTKEGGHQGVDYADGDPAANLDLIRSIFFANPGYALGGRYKRVITQAQAFDAAHPTDAKYVENVMWEQSQVLFVTLNIPGGSNNDTDPWFGQPVTQAQTDEVAERTQADLDWLDGAFAQAQRDGARAVLIQTQADMWDRDGKAATHIANYEPFIASIASHTTSFGGPVLLLTPITTAPTIRCSRDSRVSSSPAPGRASFRAARSPTVRTSPRTRGTTTRSTTCRIFTGLSCTAARCLSSGCACGLPREATRRRLRSRSGHSAGTAFSRDCSKSAGDPGLASLARATSQGPVRRARWSHG